jgi:serine protease Do
MNPPVENVLILDTPVRDNLQPRETREWRFQAMAGQELVIRMDAIGDVDPLLVLLDGERNTIDEDDDSGEGSNARLVFEVPEDGEYIILASFFDPTDSGAYEIALQSLLSFATEGGELVSGSVVEGELTDEAFETRYTFQGNAGDTVTISMSSIDGELDCYLVLIDPSGEVLAENDDHDSSEISLFFFSDSAIVGLSLPSSGTYTVLAQRYQGEEGRSEGGYELILEVQ